jgi:C4-dicarboxylate-specific signal transduction histidine kinase
VPITYRLRGAKQPLESTLASSPSPPALARTRTTLGQRLVALFILFAAAPFFAANLWGFLQSREYLTDHALRNVRDVAELEASQTLIFVAAKRDQAPLIVAGNLHLSTLLRSLSVQTDPQVLAGLQRGLHRLLTETAAQDRDAQEFLVLSAAGELMGTTEAGTAFREDRSTDPCYRAAAASPRVVGFEYTSQQRPTLVVATPIVDEFGKGWGVFCARFAFNLHRQLSADRDLHTPEGSLYLVDATGRVVDEAVGDETPATLGTTLQRPFPLLDGTPGWSARYQLPSGEETLAAYAPLPTLGWGMLVEAPVARSLASLTRLERQVAGAGGLLAVLLVLMVTLAARGVSEPITRLSSAARRVASGRLGERVPTDGPREVSRLADSFNQMSQSLLDSHQLLEQRVADATRELRQSQEFTELLLNSIDQRVVVIAPSLTIIKANHVALRAYGEGLVGRACDEALPDGPLVCDAGPVRTTFETGEPTSIERTERQGEALEVVRLDTMRITSGEKQVEAVMLVGRVVTAEKRLQAQLEKMANFGRLAVGVAHEVGNPLASIAAQLRMNREATDLDRVRQTFTVVEREVDRVIRLLRELMTFARRRRDDVTLVQLNDVVEDVSRLVAHDERTRSVRIEKRIAPGLPGVRAKEDHLTQVLLNLTLNAIDAMAGSGTLTIETTADQGFVTCRVHDTGSGIAPEVLPRLFEPFFTTKEAGRGTGLGLFVSRNLANGFGGSLEIEHTSPLGTVFAVKVPIGARGEPGRTSA